MTPQSADLPSPRTRTAIGAVQVYDGIAGITLGDTLLTLWSTPARRARVRQVTGWTEALMASTPGTIAACQFLLPSASPPDRAARAEAMAGFRTVAPRSRRLITAPLRDAAWLRLVCAIIRAGVALFGHGTLIKVASSKDQAFTLLQEVATEHSPSRQELENAFAALVAALEGESA